MNDTPIRHCLIDAQEPVLAPHLGRDVPGRHIGTVRHRRCGEPIIWLNDAPPLGRMAQISAPVFWDDEDGKDYVSSIVHPARQGYRQRIALLDHPTASLLPRTIDAYCPECQALVAVRLTLLHQARLRGDGGTARVVRV